MSKSMPSTVSRSPYLLLLAGAFLAFFVLAQQIFLTPRVKAASSTIVISEVDADTPLSGTDTANEWFELQNVSTQSITLTNWTITDNVSNDIIPTVTLGPGGHVIVAATLAGFTSEHPGFQGTVLSIADGAIGNGLGNGGDALILKDSNGSVIDALSWVSNTTVLNPAAGADSPTNTNQRNSNGTDTDTASDWTRATETPDGNTNAAPPPPVGEEHMVMGNPSNATTNTANTINFLMMKPQYALSYNDSRRIPNWTSWHLDSSWQGSAPRQDDFREDPTLPLGFHRVQGTDFAGSGFDRGHMCPSADRTSTIQDNSATFLMTNMIPQAPGNNQGPWAALENYLRTFLPANEIYIISGGSGVGGTGSNGSLNILASGVTVPALTWKVALILPLGDNDLTRVDSNTRTIAVIMPNNHAIGSDPWEDFLVTVDQVEAVSGYDFYSNVPTAVQNVIESRFFESGTVQLSSATQTIAESAGSATITVTRSGDTSGAATFTLATNDSAGTQACNIANGNASSRCDYLISLGSFSFAPNETLKTINIPIVDDGYAEGSETFTVTITQGSAPGTTLGSPSSATVTITDNDLVNGPNPVDQASFFVRQHYIDFLNREPDPQGFDFWTREITDCGSNQQCVEIKRINVSAAFFLSIEFQETGYLVYRIYKAAYGDSNSPNVSVPVPIIRLNEFLPDGQRISRGVRVGIGDWQAQLEANKTAFTREFVASQRFLNEFPLTMTAEQFVDKLNTNAGAVLSPTERSALIAELIAAGDVTQARASVLRKVAEDDDLRQQEFNRAFVLMQYYGYLRRNPDDPQDTDFRGWEFWLNKLNQFNGNFVNAEMVKAFIDSFEYRRRFGP